MSDKPTTDQPTPDQPATDPPPADTPSTEPAPAVPAPGVTTEVLAPEPPPEPAPAPPASPTEPPADPTPVPPPETTETPPSAEEPPAPTPPKPEPEPEPTPETAKAPDPPKPADPAPTPQPGDPSGIPPAVLALTDAELQIAATLFLQRNQKASSRMGVEARQAAMRHNLDDVLSQVRRDSPTRIASIAQELNMPPSLAGYYLRKLVRQHKIKATGHGASRRYSA